mgnify:CR=1 FL=1
MTSEKILFQKRSRMRRLIFVPETLAHTQINFCHRNARTCADDFCARIGLFHTTNLYLLKKIKKFVMMVLSFRCKVNIN